MQEVKTESKMKKTYIFKVVIEEDQFDDGRQAYHAYCPALKNYSASTWGYTEAEAMNNIKEVIEMIIEELIEDGEFIPDTLENDVLVFSEPMVMIKI